MLLLLLLPPFRSSATLVLSTPSLDCYLAS
jgi:hypothetical protein